MKGYLSFFKRKELVDLKIQKNVFESLTFFDRMKIKMRDDAVIYIVYRIRKYLRKKLGRKMRLIERERIKKERHDAKYGYTY